MGKTFGFSEFHFLKGKINKLMLNKRTALIYRLNQKSYDLSLNCLLILFHLLSNFFFFTCCLNGHSCKIQHEAILLLFLDSPLLHIQDKLDLFKSGPVKMDNKAHTQNYPSI